MDNPASWIWVLIPLAAIGIAPFKMWLRVKERQMEAQSGLAAEKSAQYAQHVERIEQRLRVLEQIITDKGVETAAQIEALRDRPRIRAGVGGHRRRGMGCDESEDRGETLRLRDEVQTLQERIKVLERITVEKEN